MKNKGIVERMKVVDSLDKAVKLTEEVEGYEDISSKTLRKFMRIRKSKLKEFKTKK